MGSIFYKIIGTITAFLSPVITILTGLLFSKIKEVLFTFNAIPEDGTIPERKMKIVKLVELIGILTIISGAISLFYQLINKLQLMF